jgi:hypothetical protein
MPDTVLRDIDRLVPQMGWEVHTIGGHYLRLGMNSLIPGQLLERSVRRLRRVVVDTLSGTGRSRLGILVGTECCVVGTKQQDESDRTGGDTVAEHTKWVSRIRARIQG